MPSLCGSAEATREWFRAFTAHSFLACRPLRPRGVRHRYPEIRCRHWPSPNDHRLGTPDTPAIRSARAVDFVASSGSLPLQPARLLAPQYGSDWNVQPSGTFTSRLSTDRSPSPLLDITATATGLLVWRFFCQEVSAEWPIFLPLSVSLFDLKSPFLRPRSATAARSNAVGLGPQVDNQS